MSMQHENSVRQHLNQRGGLNRLVAILLVLIAVMLVIIAIPSYRYYTYRAQKTACDQAIKTAQDGLIIEYLFRMEQESLDEARETLDQVMPERPNICPYGGTVYLVMQDNGIYDPVCGLHGSDIKQRTRLNASHAKELLETALITERWRVVGDEPLESISIYINGQDRPCTKVIEEEPLYRGTKTTYGYEGTVIFYALAGEEGFEDSKLKSGEICYFLYADENECALWREGDGWTGTAYNSV